ncbi:unnamed protein product [marine sediment metagenome]|uniref:Uncharacterized protein n=1 Tax=marine sediment metagenome TaxID=412755 RepID=X1MSI8_9ZZZZ
MSDEVLLNGVIMQKTVDGVEYTRCFHCGIFFSPTIVDMELQLFCSKECKKANDEYWQKIIAKDKTFKS